MTQPMFAPYQAIIMNSVSAELTSLLFFSRCRASGGWGAIFAEPCPGEEVAPCRGPWSWTLRSCLLGVILMFFKRQKGRG